MTCGLKVNGCNLQFEDIMLSEASQAQKAKATFSSYMEDRSKR
jgi:hypothetical protein